MNSYLISELCNSDPLSRGISSFSSTRNKLELDKKELRGEISLEIKKLNKKTKTKNINCLDYRKHSFDVLLYGARPVSWRYVGCLRLLG